ncbi:unnamed protein product [Prunus brigantina]
MRVPKTKKEVQSLTGRVTALARFISKATDRCAPFFKALKGSKRQWLQSDQDVTQRCQEAYKQVQQIITKLPTLRAPIPGLSLKLYLAATNTTVGALLAQDDHGGEENPIYYVSRQLKGAETRYPKTELLCLALVYATQRLRHYFLAHKLQLIVMTDPVRYLLTRPVLSGRLALEESMLSKEVLGELPEIVVVVTEEEPWTLYFDGSSTSKSGGAGVVLISTDGQVTTLSFKLNFSCTNNAAKYEAFIIGMSTAREMGVERIKIIGDSNLVLKQPNIAMIQKDMPLIEVIAQEQPLEEGGWRKLVKEKISKGNDIKELKDYAIIFGELYRRLPGAEVQANCPKRSTIPSIKKSFTISFAEDWKAPYLAFFIDGTLPTNSKHASKLKKTVKRYFIDGSTLYRKGFNGEPLKCLGESKAQQVMQEIHAGECGELQGMKRLYQQLLNVAYYWPTMKNDAYDFVKKVPHMPSPCQSKSQASHDYPSTVRRLHMDPHSH